MLNASSATSLLLAVAPSLWFRAVIQPRRPPARSVNLPRRTGSPMPGMTRLTGVVVEPDGQAVAGAVITWLYGGRPSTAVTDGTGVYELTLDTQPPEVVRLTVEKDGFEPSVLYVAAEGKPRLRRDLNLHRIQRIAVGESVRCRSAPATPSAASLPPSDSHTTPSQAVPAARVVSSSEGRLDIWVNGDDVEPQYRIQLAANPNDGGRSYFSTPVDAGSETVVDLVLMDARGPFARCWKHGSRGWWDY